MELMPENVEKQLENTGYYPEVEDFMDAEVIVKYFFPIGAATWLIIGGEKDEDDWILFGYATLGYGWEWGSVRLSDLKNYTSRMGLKIERDLYCGGKKVKELVCR